MSTTCEQLEGAALSLVRCAPIKDRLIDAYRNHLALVDAGELPEALREQFRACHDALTREPPLRGEDAVRATVRKMSNQEADEVAEGVVRLYGAFVREITRGEVPTANAILNSVPVTPVPAGRAKKSVPQVISLYAHEA